MTAWRRVIELSISDADVAKLMSIARSRTEPASRVERARILLGYREDPSFFAVARALGLHHQTVQRCVERALAYVPMAALDDRPRPGKEPKITAEAKAWLVSLACRKAKDLGYPHELWTTRLLARHAREYGPAEGHAASTSWSRARCARSSMSKRSSRTKCGTTWNAATRNLKKRWRKCCVFTAKSKSSRKPRSHRRRNPATRLRSSPMTRSQGSRRLPPRHRTCRRSPACMRPSPAIMNISASARSACWPASTL